MIQEGNIYQGMTMNVYLIFIIARTEFNIYCLLQDRPEVLGLKVKN